MGIFARKKAEYPWSCSTALGAVLLTLGFLWWFTYEERSEREEEQRLESKPS
jgi:hypothetical protein